MEVKVTQEHIDKGKQGSSIKCPIAIALEEMGHIACVSRLSVLVMNRNFYLPFIASEFVKDFDAGRPVKPFSFVL